MSNFDPPSTFGVGTTVVSYSATDFVGNTSSESFSVTIIDPDDPQFISTPGALLVGTADDQCGSIVEWAEPQAIDCSSLVIVTSTHQPGDFFLIGTTEVTYTATDVAGKSTDLIFPVTVEDGFAPTFVSAPADILVASLAGECSAEISWDEPVVSDGCSLFTVTSSHDSATVFSAGITPVTYTATDDIGNIREHVFFVTVNDGEGPTFDTELPDISSPSNLGICGAQIFWTEPVAVDNCTAATVSSTHGPGTFFAVGITTVTYTARTPLPDGFRDAFELSVQLPESVGEALVFPTIQTCEQGESAWIQVPQEGQAEDELELPAPAFVLTEATGGGHHGEENGAAEGVAASSDDVQRASSVAPETRSGNVVPVLGLVAGLIGVLLGGAALVLQRRRV